MPVINHKELNDAIRYFEALVDALEDYLSMLEGRRVQYERENRDPATSTRVVNLRIDRVNELLEILNGEAFDVLRWIIDGVATLDSVDEGRHV